MSSTGRHSSGTGQASDPFRAWLQNEDGSSVGKPESASKGTDGHSLAGSYWGIMKKVRGHKKWLQLPKYLTRTENRKGNVYN